MKFHFWISSGIKIFRFGWLSFSLPQIIFHHVLRYSSKNHANFRWKLDCWHLWNFFGIRCWLFLNRNAHVVSSRIYSHACCIIMLAGMNNKYIDWKPPYEQIVIAFVTTPYRLLISSHFYGTLSQLFLVTLLTSANEGWIVNQNA